MIAITIALITLNPKANISEEDSASEIATPTIAENSDMYNYTRIIHVLYLSPKSLLVDNTVDNKITEVVNPIEALKNLKENTADFFEAGEQFEVDPYLVMAIGILESKGGQSVPAGSNNPFGRVCGKGYECVIARDATTEKNLYWIKFESFKEAIFDEAKYLRTQYLDRGLITPQQINQKYAEDKDWYKKIEAIITRIKG